MKNLVFFAVVISFFFFSCASSKLATTDKKQEFESFSLGMIENFNITPAMLEKMQFFSGADTIVLENRTKVATGSVASDGTLLLTGGNPIKKYLILPNTPGTVAPKGIILGPDKKVKEILVSFSDNENNALSFEPSDDEFGTFILGVNKPNRTVNNPEGQTLMVEVFYSEQQDQSKIEPGRLVGQKKVSNDNTEKKVPNEKLKRNN
ncbi:MAG: hypothetical protein WC011_03795 [Candidatus Paceibacterota bacterium]